MATADLIDGIAEQIMALGTERRVRVAVDGITAAGKTTFAQRLADGVQERGRPVIRVSMDGFHHPRAVRYQQGRGSADGYYEDAYDFGSARRALLDPLGLLGDGRYRTAVIDLAADEPVDEPPELAAQNAVLVVDASFPQKREVRDAWDFVVYLRASFEAAEERGARRDAELLGGVDAARSVFRSRYHAAHRRYLAECDPEANADIVIDVEDPAAPVRIR